MATITEIMQKVDALAVRTANEIDALRVEMASVSGSAPEWDLILNKPSTFPPNAHTHVSGDVTDFNAAVDDRIALAGGGDAPDWTSITGKPSTFPPSAHTQTVSTITDFTAEVNSLIAAAGAGDGNVVGPAGGVVDGEIAVYNGTTGVAIKGSGITPSANGISLIEGADYAAMRTQLGLVIGTDVQAYSAKLGTLAGQTWAADKLTYQTGGATLGVTDLTAFGRGVLALTDYDAFRGNLNLKENIIVAVGDETTVITSGTNKIKFRMPYGLTNIEVRASLSEASSSGLVTVDVNENGVSILSTKITIDQGELTSQTAATAPFVSDAVLGDDNEISIDIDTAGTGAKGLKVTLIGKRP